MRDGDHWHILTFSSAKLTISPALKSSLWTARSAKFSVPRKPRACARAENLQSTANLVGEGEDLGTLMRSELRRPTGLTATGVARTTFSLDCYCAYRSTRIGPFTSGAIDASGARGANGAHTNTHQRAWRSWSTRDWIPRRH